MTLSLTAVSVATSASNKSVTFSQSKDSFPFIGGLRRWIDGQTFAGVGINWIGNVVAPVGAVGTVSGGIVGFMSGRHVGRWLFAALLVAAERMLTRPVQKRVREYWSSIPGGEAMVSNWNELLPTD